MSGSVNKVIILGNVTADPEVRNLSDGSKVVNLSVATNERWKDKSTGEKMEKSEFHRVSLFGDGLIGVIEKYVKKGSKVYIDGRLKTRKWQDQSGADRYTTEIVVSGPGTSLVLCGDRSGGGAKAPPADSAESYRNVRSGNAPPPRNDMNDEIPF